MRRSKSTSDTELLFNPEIEKFCRANKKEYKRRKEAEKEEQQIFEQEETIENMENQNRAIGGNNGANEQNGQNAVVNQNDPQRRSMLDYAFPRCTDVRDNRPIIGANQFELKTGLIQMVQNSQFGGSPLENPHSHLKKFLMICGTQRQPGVSDEVIRLTLFPFSLRDSALEWYDSLPQAIIATWEQLSQAFLSQFFPPGKTTHLRNLMVAFKPRDDETLYESWMRFKELERQCPHHEIPKWMIVQNFYTRVTPAIRNTIDSQAGGDFMRMTSEECYDLLEKIAHNTHLWGNPRALEPKKAGIYELDSVSYMNARFNQLT